jgi:hypothetical protein
MCSEEVGFNADGCQNQVICSVKISTSSHRIGKSDSSITISQVRHCHVNASPIL